MRMRTGLFALATLATVILAIASPAAAQNLKVTGVVYSQYAYSLSDTVAHNNGFEVTRAYLNVLGSFEHGISTRLTSDIYRNADGSLGYRLKYGYFGWTPEHAPVTVKFGLQQTPWLDWEEQLWEYRMQGAMALDRNGYLTSADLGVGAEGSWAKNLLNAQALVMNGEGYAKPSGDRRKDGAVRASVRLLPSDDESRVGGLRLTGYGHLGAYTGGGDRNRWIGMLSYKSKLFTLAGEYAATTDISSTASPLVEIHGRVLSGLGVLRVPNTPLALVARVDGVDRNLDAADDAFATFIGGASYRLSPNVLLLADIDANSFQLEPLPAAVQANKTRLLFQTQFTF